MTLDGDFSYLEERDVQRIADYFLNHHKFRYGLMTLTCFYTGVRSNELRHIKISDINFLEKEIYITHAKLKRPRLVPFPEFLGKYIKKYIHFFGLRKDNYLFFADRSKNEPIFQTRFNKALTKASKKLRLPHVYPHMLRHSFAIMFIKRTGDQGLSILQKILGHASAISTLQYYQRFNMKDVKRMYRRYVETPVSN